MRVRVAGVDVSRGSWVAVVLSDGRFEVAVRAGDLARLVSLLGAPAAIAVDIPIGLPSGADDWPRAADLAARERLGPRRSSVFLTAPRPVLEDCATFTAANAAHRRLTGKGLSRQSFALRERILEADSVAGSAVVREVHPEVSFAALAASPLAYPKKTWNGQNLRRRLLADAGIELPDIMDGAAGRVPADDLLDAAAAAWSARRIAEGRAECLGEPFASARPNAWAGALWC